jgi:pimeloyl-ACP methyl ester carboxylesterase
MSCRQRVEPELLVLQQCRHVIIVAHSMGGLVARALPQRRRRRHQPHVTPAHRITDDVHARFAAGNAADEPQSPWLGVPTRRRRATWLYPWSASTA